MKPNPPREVFIQGLTHAGKVFRPGDWAERLTLLLRELPAGLAGQVSESARPDGWLQPLALLLAALALAGLLDLARRRAWLPLAVVVAAVLAISLFSARVEPVVTVVEIAESK